MRLSLSGNQVHDLSQEREKTSTQKKSNIESENEYIRGLKTDERLLISLGCVDLFQIAFFIFNTFNNE